MSKRKPNTRPPRFDRTLTYESQQARAGTEELQEELDAKIDALQSKEKLSVTEMRELMGLRSRSRRVELSLDYQGANPKTLPKAIVKEIANGPVFEGIIEDQYRAKINNRTSAIRAKCVTCMSGQPGLIRECVNVGCPLYMFRMGDNPLHGFDIPKLEFASDEDDNDFEDENDEE